MQTVSSYVLARQWVWKKQNKTQSQSECVWEAHFTELSKWNIKNIQGAHEEMTNAWWRQTNKVWNDKKNKASKKSDYTRI